MGCAVTFILQVQSETLQKINNTLRPIRFENQSYVYVDVNKRTP